MSEPVDTNALRASSDALAYVGGSAREWPDSARIEDAKRELRAAADEVDQLRSRLERFDEVGAYAALRAELSIERVRHSEWMQKASRTVHKLRAVINSAPHDPLCRRDRTDALAYRGQASNCTCWKADVLV
jgi:hypothetical protein